MEALISDLPLRLEGLTDEDDFYMALLRVGRGCRLCTDRAAALAVKCSLWARLHCKLVPSTIGIDSLLPLLPCISVQVPEGYAHPAAPIWLSGSVTSGFGRGEPHCDVLSCYVFRLRAWQRLPEAVQWPPMEGCAFDTACIY